MGVDEAIEAEAQAQAICMKTQDFRPRLPRVRGEAEAGLRGLKFEGADMSRASSIASTRSIAIATSRLAVLRGPRIASSRASSTPGPLPTLLATTTATSTLPAARWCGKLGDAGWLRHASAARVRRRCRRDRHARDLPAARDAGAPLRPRRFRLRHAGPGLGRDHARRHAGAETRAICRAWPRGEAIAAFALSEPDAGSDVAAMSLRRPRRRRRLRARRREDLDLQRRHRRFLRRVRPHRRGAGGSAASPPSSSMPARRASASPSAST